MCLRKNSNNDKFVFDNVCLKNSNEEVILGITTFDSHVKNIYRKASQKLCPLSWISNYMKTNERKIFFCGMIKSQFSYCSLIWMFYSRKSNNLINKIHERSLRIISDDKESVFHTLRENQNQKTMHQRNLQTLMIEIYKY